MGKPQKYFAIQQAGRTAEVYIYGDIVPYPWDNSDMSGQTLADQIKEMDVDIIHVYINSYGGSVSEAWAMYNALRRHPAKVVTYGEGFVASAALYPFLAGDERYASSMSAYYLHEVMVYADGYAKDMRAAAEEADMLTTIGIGAFVEQAGMREETVRELMANETWLAPGEALELGIATGILRAETETVTQSARRDVMGKIFQREKDPGNPAGPVRQKGKNSVLGLFENI